MKLSDRKLSPLGLALGTVISVSLVASNVVMAADNPFEMTPLASGYRVAEESSQGSDKKMEGRCGGKTMTEAVCGAYQIGSGHVDESKIKDGKCGGHKQAEGVCGGY